MVIKKEKKKRKYISTLSSAYVTDSIFQDINILLHLKTNTKNIFKLYIKL